MKTSPSKKSRLFNCPKKNVKYSPIRPLNQYKRRPRDRPRFLRTSRLGARRSVGSRVWPGEPNPLGSGPRSAERGHVLFVRVPLLRIHARFGPPTPSSGHRPAAGRERTPGSDRQRRSGMTWRSGAGKYLEQYSALGFRTSRAVHIVEIDTNRREAYLGLEAGRGIWREGERFWKPPWGWGGVGGRRGCFQAGFWRRLIGWGMTDL